MSNDNREPQRNKSAVIKPFVPESAAWVGMTLFVVGIGVMYMSSRARPALMDTVNYTGIAIAAVGCLLWFISGMDRAQLFEWLRSGATALLLALMIRWAVAEPYRIPSGSMEPTLHGDPRFGRGDRVFVNKWVYGLRYPFMNKRIWYGKAPERWDLVVFKTVEEDAVHKTLVKRIVGMPGEHVQIRDGRVYADGEPLELPSEMSDDTYFTTPLDGPYGVQTPERFSVIPDGHYLVLGDNSAHSRDGRYFGWVPNEHIVGRVSCIWFPPQRWRDFTGFARTWWWRGILALVFLAIILRLFVGRLYPAHNADDPKKIDHLVVSFAQYGLHLPAMSRLATRWRAPQRGELVMYAAENPEDNVTHLLVGRVAALPGEHVQLQDGLLTVDNETVKLPPPAPECYAGPHGKAKYGRGKSKEHSVVPEKHYFILADETIEDALPPDSRTLGWIPLERIAGRAVWCWWPPQRMGRR